MMKGPNAALPCVDNLKKKIFPNKWNNIPVPLCEAIEELMHMFVEFKKLYHSNYNMIVTTQRAINTNQQSARTELNQARTEFQENLILADEERDRVLGEQELKFVEMLKTAEVELEARLSSLISNKVREETLVLRQWTTNLVREKVNDDSKQLRQHVKKEITAIKKMFYVPSFIGKADFADEPGSPNKSKTPESPMAEQPLFSNFGHFVREICQKEKEDSTAQKNLSDQIDVLNDLCKELKERCDEKQTLKESTQTE